MEHSLTQCQIIPNRIILKNNNYAHRKIIINKKFQWLNKYLSVASPKMLNLNTFILYNNKSELQKGRSRSLAQGSRLKTSEDCSSRQNILTQKNWNNYQMRKTTSSQIKGKDTKKLVENNNAAGRFFRCKKNKSQFSRNNRIIMRSDFKTNNIVQIQDSQIKPWNFQNFHDDQNGCFKENQRPTYF